MLRDHMILLCATAAAALLLLLSSHVKQLITHRLSTQAATAVKYSASTAHTHTAPL
jgi:hypothetical protein